MPSMRDDSLRLDDAVAILERTPASLTALLKDLPERWVQATEGAGTWSPYYVIGHLIHGERTDWMPRARHIMAGDSRPFEPFDRTAQFTDSQGKNLGELLVAFAELRRENLATLLEMNVANEDLNRRGLHPELGGVTLGLIESLAIALVSSGYKDVIAMVLLILIMILMPQGLLGRRGRRGG